MSIGCALDPCGHGVELSDETLLPSQLLMRGALAVFTAFLPQKVAVEKLDVGEEEREKLAMNGIICPATWCFCVSGFFLAHF